MALIGHMLGGWVVNANYVLASGQRYTPAQLGRCSVWLERELL